MKFWVFALFTFLLTSLLVGSSAEQCGNEADYQNKQRCGRQGRGARCRRGLCCNKRGWCGNTFEDCGPDCQSQCRGGIGSGGGDDVGDIGRIIPRGKFDDMLKHRNDNACPGKGFYTYDAFITAAKSFPGFATTGDDATRKKEIAAFLGQTSHETTGRWASAPDGSDRSYCSSDYPCPKQYYGRGPIQLSWNYNYHKAGQAIGVDLINNPDLVATNAVISFETAIWFWMTAQSPKPSCHDVITGKWEPSGSDIAAGRVAGYGVITNIINGGIECGKGQTPHAVDKIGFYKRYCQILGIETGNNLDCYNQTPFGNGSALVNSM